MNLFHNQLMLIYIFIALSATAQPLFAQVGINNPNPDSSALLDLKSNDKGILIPRMTTIDRANMTTGGKTPAHALMVFDVDQNAFFVFDTTANPDKWMVMNPWSCSGSTGNLTTSTTGNVGIGTTAAPTVRLEVNGTVKATDYSLNAIGNGPIPQGGIIMWSGNPSAIPTGWALCDGSNGTPDLKGRFIVGYNPTDPEYSNTQKTGPVFTDADGSSTGSNTQDAKQIRLTSAQSGLPVHNHTLIDTGHIHTYNYQYTPESGPGYTSGPNRQLGLNQLVSSVTTTDKTNIRIQSSVTQNASLPIENRPPYFVLAYIIKL